MSHLLEQTADGRWKFVGNAPGWHGLGEVIEGHLGVDEALKVAGLSDWNVRLVPAYAFIPETGEYVEIPHVNGVVRNNQNGGTSPEPLHVIGTNWAPIQAEEWAEFAKALLTVDEKPPAVSAAGSIRGGRQVFMTLEMPKPIVVGDGDTTVPYVVLSNNNDGMGSLILTNSFVRAVCANTVDAVLADTTQLRWKVRHSKSLDLATRQAEAAEALGHAYNLIEQVQAEADALIMQKVTAPKFAKMVKALFPVDKDATDAQKAKIKDETDVFVDLYRNAGTQDGIRGTGWGVLQAAVEYADWQMPRVQNRAAAQVSSKGRVHDFKARARQVVLATA